MTGDKASAPDSRTVLVTFRAEALRAVASGVQETALATFAILIAVKHFQSGPAAKATLLSSLALGLLGGFYIVPLVARLRWKVSYAAGAVQLVSMSGFLIAAGAGSSELLYLVGMFIGMGVIALAIPLQTHYLKTNFPEARRGRLFSISIVIKALSVMLFSWLIGWYLDRDFSQFPRVILLFALASGMAAVAQLMVPSGSITKGGRKPPISQSVQWLREDVDFARVIVAAMAMGIGVLSANALRVDYLVNPEHDLVLGIQMAAVITGVVPSVARIVSTFFWGWLFDKIDQFRLRVMINLVFITGIFLYFASGNLPAIIVGSALFGLARGGGEILWNLWVTRMTEPDRTADYMSIHTFTTGLRMAAAPFIGFYLVGLFNLQAMIGVCVAFMVASLIILWPLLVPSKKQFG